MNPGNLILICEPFFQRCFPVLQGTAAPCKMSRLVIVKR
jgi:hypothetical protein